MMAVSFPDFSFANGENYKLGYGKPCWECHREVPHGRYNSQASTPYARVPVKRIVVSD